jgi:hypothetical protein
MPRVAIGAAFDKFRLIDAEKPKRRYAKDDGCKSNEDKEPPSFRSNRPDGKTEREPQSCGNQIAGALANS